MGHLLRNWARLYTNPTVHETVFERCISQYGKPYRAQHPFFRYGVIVDFALIEDRIVVEIDGPSHDTPVQRYKDLLRDIRFEEDGWRVVRIPNRAVYDFKSPTQIMDAVATRRSLEELREALREFPEPPVVASKPRARRPKPAPKSSGRRPRKKE